MTKTVTTQSSIENALNTVRARCDVAARRESDPVGFVHAAKGERDKELVALMASSLAFGNVVTIRAKLRDALDRIGEPVWRAADDEARLFMQLEGWVHRVYRGDDLAGLLIGARRAQRQSGSLGELFIAHLKAAPDLQEALARFCDSIRNEAHIAKSDARGERALAHLLPDPRRGGGCKRLLLFLRWMIRPSDGVDLGLWAVDPSRLLCPVDTHIHKLSLNLGFTTRKQLSWQAAAEITAALACFDQADPVKYDFSLCHLGMLQRCPSRRDAVRCEGCGVKPVCRHWRATSSRRARA